ncbi:MAG: RNA polymerase sigma-70 factor [Bacteroidales bacterium]
MVYEDKLEQELLRLIKNNDERFLELLFKLYYSKLCVYATTFIKIPDLAEEIVQETFIKFWENRASIKIDISFKAYIFKSVHNNCINYLKKSDLIRRQSKQMFDEIMYHNELALQNFSSEIIESLVSDELESRLNNALDDLPPQSRKIFIMNRFDQLTYNEIAKELKISVNTVKTQMKRALKKLREVFNPL